MATKAALPDILSSFTAATEAVFDGLPASSSLLPPKDGITLLDTKNEIFLSYLQALALRNLNVIRSIRDGSDTEDALKLSNDITQKLVEHRVYLERGVRPLEQKIKYQVDKVVKAADDEERVAAQKAKSATATNGRTKAGGEDASEDSDDEASDSDEPSEAGADITATSYRPNAASFAQATAEDANTTRRARSKEDGVYRPPRISATAMPTTEQRDRKDRRPERSRTVDEYISTELSTAPTAEPSIGSTITAGGRRNKDARQLAKEAERREYEETNLVRLPKESKKDLAKRQGRGGDGGFGGEEWRDLGANVGSSMTFWKRM